MSNSQASEFRIAAVGDIMLAGTAEPELKKFGYDYAFAATKHLLEADVVFGNLEAPITDHDEMYIEKKYRFRQSPKHTQQALKNAGFNIVSLANNHTLDYGPTGMEDTQLALDQVGIKYVGAGDNMYQARWPDVVTTSQGVRVAFLAYSLTFPEEFWADEDAPGTAFARYEHIETDIRKAKIIADIVCVSFHWGRESTTKLRPYQSKLGKLAIDAGAAAVIGHHPHILQGVERYKDGIILYSLGNYTFGSFSRRALFSAVAHLYFKEKQLARLELHPIYVSNIDVIFQPQPLSGDVADGVISEIQYLSAQQNTVIENQNGVAVYRFD
ncbi:MAG: CapA family protein [Gammaproteobacteria bacterium]|nr:CapA family protein [Gammaproteobacteria bacterium]MDH5728964.1 CapA family protein [Gammaproteobacteria bacterium]